MADRSPSLMALLGLLAVAGFQNRDKIAEMLGRATSGATSSGNQAPPQSGLGSLLDNLRSPTSATGGTSGFLSAGLTQLVERFTQNGHGDTASSWIAKGGNAPIEPSQLEQAIGPDILDTLSRQTGLSTSELLSRLSRELPSAVDKYTPDGRLPA